MSRIPQTFIDDLLNRLDIVEVVDPRVKLKKAGKNYSACCPFHDEKTPSFTVSPDKQFYYCFGCGASGNAIGFVMEYDRSSFVDAVENLAKLAGLQVPREESRTNYVQESRQKNLYAILDKASTFYQTQLKSHPQKQRPVRYLQNRGLSGAIARDFGVGYAPPGWDNLLKALGQTEADQEYLTESGMLIERDEDHRRYDRFRERIMFPILDNRGRVIGFGGRVLDDSKPKYLNSPETPVFQKGRELYGLYQARQANRSLERILIVEGYMDVIALAQYDIRNAVATLGTACGEEHLRLAFKHTQEIVFCFDGDNAGRTAAKRALMAALTSMEDGRQIRFLFLAEGQDPDTLVRQIGAERFLAQIKNGVPLEDFVFEVAAEGIDINSMDGRARFSKIAAPMLNLLPSGIYRELMFTNLAKRTGLSGTVLMELTQEALVLPTSAPKQSHSSQLLGVPTTDSSPSTTANKAAPETPNRSEDGVTPKDTYPDISEPDVDPQADHLADYYSEQFAAQANELPLHELGSQFQQRRPDDSVPAAKRSSISLNPVRAATLLLLDNPQLLKSVSERPLPKEGAEPDLARLYNLIDYLEKRPDSNFNNLLGHWGGTYGLESQQELAKLLASHELTLDAAVAATEPQAVIRDAFAKINRLIQQQQHKLSFAELQAKGLANLSDAEKDLYRELIRKH